MEVDPTSIVNIAIKHGGLKGRIIDVDNASRMVFREYSCSEDEVESSISTSLSGLETNLVELVKQLIVPLFTLFNFFKLEDAIYEEIINTYVQGRMP